MATTTDSLRLLRRKVCVTATVSERGTDAFKEHISRMKHIETADSCIAWMRSGASGFPSHLIARAELAYAAGLNPFNEIVECYEITIPYDIVCYQCSSTQNLKR